MAWASRPRNTLSFRAIKIEDFLEEAGNQDR